MVNIRRTGRTCSTLLRLHIFKSTQPHTITQKLNCYISIWIIFEFDVLLQTRKACRLPG